MGELKRGLLDFWAAAVPILEAANTNVFWESEGCRPRIAQCADSPVELTVRQWVKERLQHWCGLKLTHTATYGIREYRRGNILRQHVDRLMTHAISAIVHVESEGLDRDWPLEVVPHDAETVEHFCMGPGNDVIFYESATVPHGRTRRLEGDA